MAGRSLCRRDRLGAYPLVTRCQPIGGHIAGGGSLLIHYVASTGSTNADLLSAVAAGRGIDSDWLVARRQTAGRGRQGRHWDSPEGNFHGSTLIKLCPGDPPAATLSLMAGVALHQAVLDCAAVPGLQLKWPNDLMVGTAKLGGILLERSGDAIVCGLGVNLSWAPDVPGRATVSLANLGHRVTVDDFAGRLATGFAASLARWRTLPPGLLSTDWLARAHPLGTMLARLDGQGNPLTGRFDGLEDDGSLRLRAADGTLLVVSSGEVMLA